MFRPCQLAKVEEKHTECLMHSTESKEENSVLHIICRKPTDTDYHKSLENVRVISCS